MSRLGHSTLLKYFVDTPNMAEQKTDVTAIESEVPEKQELREGITEGTMDGANNSKSDTKNSVDEENPVTTKVGFVYSPVITVTKEESTFTKGDVKLQKVIVSEDISDNSSTTNNTLRIREVQSPNETHTEIRSEVTSLTMDTDSDNANNDINNSEGEKHPNKISKIPKLRLKQVVEKIKNEKRMIRNKDENETLSTQRAPSSIPRLKDLKNPSENLQKNLNQNKNEQSVVSPGVDAEFDKIYEQILEGESSNSLPSLEKISDPVKLECKFEEIIHHYDDNQIQRTEKIKSKIPLLKRKSEQEIEIPLPNIRRNSLKKSNTDNKDDSKANISLGVFEEKTYTADVENIGKNNSTNSSTIDTNSAKIKSEIIVKKSYNYKNKTSLESTTTQKSKETIELVNISSTGNINEEIMEHKLDSKCTIPVITTLKEDVKLKINSASLNKHPMRKNIIDRISVQQTLADKEDKTNEKEVVGSLPNTLLKVESFTDIGQNDKTSTTKNTTSEAASFNKKVISEKVTSVSEDNNKNTYISSKTSYTDKNNYIEQDIITTESLQSLVFDMPTIPSNLTKLEKRANINKINSLSSGNPPHSINNLPGEKESKQFENATKPKNTSFDTHSLKHENTTQNLLSSENKDKQSTGAMIHQNDTVIYLSEINNKSRLEQSSSFVAQKGLGNNEELTVYTNRDKNNTSDSKQLEKADDLMKPSNIGEQKNNINKSDTKNSKINIESNQKGIVSISKIVYAINNESKEMRIEDQISQDTFLNKTTLINLESRLEPSCPTNNNNTIEVAKSNILRTTVLESKQANETSEEQTYETKSSQQMTIHESRDTSIKESLIYSKNIFEDNEKTFEKLVSVEETNQESNKNIELYLSTQNTNITDTEEEDIIVLKGKVNRVIRRLDSKEYKASKKEMEDVPKEVSVISKIAIFENESKNAVPQENGQNPNTRLCDNKPKIVDEIFKNTNKNYFNINHNEIENKPNQEKLVGQDFQDEKFTKKMTKIEPIKSKIITSETTKKQRNASTTYESNEFFTKEDQKSSLEIWNEYRMRKQASDIQRARSLAELDLGDAVNGRVKQMVVRMNSVDRTNMAKKQFIDFKEKPRIGSVSQRIALFEVRY